MQRENQLAEHRADVVIVGAGISGLAAARQLVDHNLTVVVLEARDRVGGRLLSAQAPGGGLDLGATWFWPGEAHVAELIRDLGIEVFAHHIDGDAMYHQPAGSQRIQGNPIDVPSGRFVDGADSLTTAIAERLPDGVVRLGQVVESVTTTDGGLAVATAKATWSARHVILALPPALAVHRIEFTPQLPERTHGLAKMTPVWMGATTKVVAHYSTAFWREDGLAGAAISHYGPMREIHDMSGPNGAPAAVFGFVPASSGEATVTEEAVVAQLVEIFGGQAAEPTQVIIQDWRHEPFTSPPGVEELAAYQTYGHALFAQPAMGGRLHWSSTETARQAPGHIEGAIAAAHRAVQAIVNDAVGLNDTTLPSASALPTQSNEE